MTVLGRATAEGLDKTGNDDRGANNLDKGDATAGEMVEHSAGIGVPAANLKVVSAELRAGALVTTGETRAGTLPNLGGDDIREGVPPGGEAKLQTCAAGSLGRADTTFVLLGNHVEPGHGGTFEVFASTDGPTAGVHATKGELAAGTPGSLAGHWGKLGARGATVT